MNIVVRLPDEIERRLQRLTRINFRLWLFIVQQDLWKEAKEFVQDSSIDYEELPFEEEWFSG